MKRLLKIGLNTFSLSILQILSFFILSITIDKSLLNIFSLTYPIQFISILLVSIFGTGANISQEKTEKDYIYSGLVYGVIVSTIIFTLLTIFSKNYVNFMNFEQDIDNIFVIFSIMIIYCQTILNLLLEKFYFEEKESLSNKICISFNILIICLITILSLICKNKILIVTSTISISIVFLIIIYITQFKKFKFCFSILNNIKFELQDIITNILLLCVYLFGFSNAFVAGEDITKVIGFIVIISDCQWDMMHAIVTVSKVDTLHGDFNFKKSLKNGYSYTLIIITSIVTLFFCLFRFYDINLKLALICLGLEIVDFLVTPPFYVLEPYFHLEYSAIKNTIFVTIDYSIYLFGALLIPSGFCTYIGQLTSSTFVMILYLIVLFKNFIIQKDGNIKQKR